MIVEFLHFVQVHRTDFVDKPSDEHETVVVPICIEPLNKDNDIGDTEMGTVVKAAEEGEKRKRKRVPRKNSKS